MTNVSLRNVPPQKSIYQSFWIKPQRFTAYYKLTSAKVALLSVSAVSWNI